MNSCFSHKDPGQRRRRSFRTFRSWLALGLLLLTPALTQAQTWQSKSTNVNGNTFFPCVSLLLTDGSVIMQDAQSSRWWKLTPDSSGSYVNGAFTQIASMPSNYGPLYYASAVLADGRVVALGGEYNLGGSTAADTNLGAIYNPVTNVWSALAGPPGWANIGDASCTVLADGTFLLANQFGSNGAVMNPTTLAWTNRTFTGKADPNSEEGWTLLQDGTILTVDCQNGTHAEKYNTLTNTWSSAGSTIVTLPATPGGIVPEMGPQVLRPDGTVIAFGASGHNSVYHPATNTWTAAPDFPNGLDCADGPAVLLPSGNVFVITSPGIFNAGAKFFEFDGTSMNAKPDMLFNGSSVSTYFTNMLLLPTGQVLLTYTGGEIEIYTPTGSPQDSWRPTITSSPSAVTRGTTNTITGTQFNGLSQACAYGDDSSNATNYPLVRATYRSTGHVVYFRTHDHSTMAVATGSTPVSTSFDVPSNAELGVADLVVVSNGIPSASVPLTIGVPPTANAQSVSVAFNTATPLTLTGSDTNAPVLPITFALGTSPAHGSLSGFDSATGAVTYTPNAGYHGTDSFTFTVTDSAGLTSSAATVTLTVSAGTPTANAQTVAVNHNTAKALTLTGSDPDSPPLSLTYTVATNPAHGTLSGTAPNLTYTPNANYQGTDSLKFTVTNGFNTSSVATVTLNVAAGTPAANGQSLSTNQDTALGISLTGTDPDSPALPLTFAVGTFPTHGVLSFFNAATGTVTYTPNAGYSGTDSFTFTVTNGSFTSAPATVNIGVTQTVFDISTQIEITRGVFLFQRSTNTYTQTLTLKNTGSSAITGPISVILSNLTGGTLQNATGTTSAILAAGRPYINVLAANLPPGASTTVTLSFTRTGAAGITYSTQVVTGPGAR